MHTGGLFKNKVKQTVMKYKVGDKVRVKSLEWYNQNKDSDGNIYLNDFGIPFIKGMSVFCGRKAVIASIFGEEYKIDIDKNRCNNCFPTTKNTHSLHEIQSRR